MLADGGVAVEQSEDALESDDDDGMDTDAEKGEWDDGFEESSDEGGVEPRGEQEEDQVPAALG